MTPLTEDALKATRNLHRAIITISVVSLVFAFSLRRPERELSIKTNIEELLDFPFLNYDTYAQAKIDQFAESQLHPIAEGFTEKLQAKEHIIFSQNHIGYQLATPIQVGRFIASDTILTELTTSSLERLGQLSPILETHRNIQVLLPETEPLIDQIDYFLQSNPVTGASIENIRFDVDIEDIANPHFVGEQVTCSLYFELRQVGTVRAAPTFNATFMAEVVEIGNSSFNQWLSSIEQASQIVDAQGEELKWLPGLNNLKLKEKNSKLGELLAEVTKKIEEVGPNKQTVSFLGTTIPGILITIATPVVFFFLQYYFSSHMLHLTKLEESERNSFRNFAWMPLSLGPNTAFMELLWTTLLLPSCTLITLWIQITKFEPLGWFPISTILLAFAGIIAFSIRSLTTLKKLRMAAHIA